MDLQTRKYNFIQELFSIEKESIMDALERVLKQEREEHFEITASHKDILDKRLEVYKKEPNDLLNWDDVKQDW